MFNNFNIYKKKSVLELNSFTNMNTCNISVSLLFILQFLLKGDSQWNHLLQSDVSSSILIYTCSYIFFSVLTELGRSSQAFAELAGRTEGMMTDVVMALIEMGELPNLIHVVCFISLCLYYFLIKQRANCFVLSNFVSVYACYH